MELGKPSVSRHEYRGSRVIGKKTLFFLGFLFVIGVILISTFYNDFSITGNFLGNKESGPVSISSDMSIPDMSIKGDYPSVRILGIGNVIIYIEGKEFILDKPSNLIVVEDFSGRISFDNKAIYEIDARASKVFVNGLPISSKGVSKISIELNSDVFYNLLNVESGVFLERLDYVASGRISADRNSLNFNDERVVIKNFNGKLGVENKRLLLKGLVDSVSIQSDTRKMSISG